MSNLKNFQFTHDDQTLWYSRSIVCTAYIYCQYKDEWYVLAAKRGNSVEYPHYMNVPGGYLDHGETCEECAIREVREETNLHNHLEMSLYNIDSIPRGKSQPVIFRYWCNLGNVKNLPQVNTDNADDDEVIDVKWIKLSTMEFNVWLPDNEKYIWEIWKNKIYSKWWLRIF